MAKGDKIYLATKQELQDVAANAGTKIQEITQQAYNALSEENKNKSDVIYRITDADSTAVLISMQLGETSTTAFAGNRGKTLEDTVNNDCLKGGIITGTLTSGNTSAILTSNKITSNSIIINTSCSKSGLSPSSVNIETGRITLTFSAAQNEDVAIKVIIINGGE